MATTSTMLAKISGNTLGRTCLRMMCQLLEPMARARSMNCSSRTRSASERTTRAVPGQLVMPMMMMIIKKFWPQAAARTIASGSQGMTRKASVRRIHTSPCQPP